MNNKTYSILAPSGLSFKVKGGLIFPQEQFTIIYNEKGNKINAIIPNTHIIIKSGTVVDFGILQINKK